jgi:pimeloyl-ACP methyl ester carboxylesterase
MGLRNAGDGVRQRLKFRPFIGNARWTRAGRRASALSMPTATNARAVKTRQISSREYPRQVAGLVATAMLACIVCAHVAIAGQIPAIKQTAAQTADAHSALQPKAAEPSPVLPRGRAYLFRGAMGLIFSRGMDRLTEKIERAGLTANVYEFTVCDLVAGAAIETYRQDPAPIILIGHSMGGRCALQFSEKLRDEGIPVSLVVTVDPAHLSPDVPLNVERFINIFLSKDVLGGGDIKPTQGFRGNYASYDLAQHDEVSHISIDKMDQIHQQLVAKIVQLSATPAKDLTKDDAEPLPLRYVVPPKTEIELWDSGMAVAAHPGDTLPTLAERYHLPLWSLTQLNPMPENAALIAGQRIIVPRHLAPPAAVSEPMSSGH